MLKSQTHASAAHRLHVVVGGRPAAGAPAKKLMLFVHGFPEAHFSWRHQLAVGARRLPVSGICRMCCTMMY